MTPAARGLRLRSLTPDDEAEATQAHTELAAEEFPFLLHRERSDTFAAYVDLLDRQRRGVGLAPGMVPATFLVADVDGDLVGRTSIRHALNERLLEEGGHVGFGVRPAFRRCGFATRILELSLDHLGELGVSPVLVTCDDDNVGSRAVIERCGGKLENRIQRPDRPVLVRRYWIG